MYLQIKHLIEALEYILLSSRVTKYVRYMELSTIC